jgi:hypothetical protein
MIISCEQVRYGFKKKRALANAMPERNAPPSAGYIPVIRI